MKNCIKNILMFISGFALFTPSLIYANEKFPELHDPILIYPIEMHGYEISLDKGLYDLSKDWNVFLTVGGHFYELDRQDRVDITKKYVEIEGEPNQLSELNVDFYISEFENVMRTMEYPPFYRTVSTDLKSYLAIPQNVAKDEIISIPVHVRVFYSNYGKDLNPTPYHLFHGDVVLRYKKGSSISDAVSDPSGIWFDPKQSGVGFFIHQTEQGTLLQFYGYQKDGKPLWLNAKNLYQDRWPVAYSEKDTENTLTFELLSSDPNNGANFNHAPQGKDSSGLRPWGSVEIGLTSCTTGFAELTGIDGTQRYELKRLTSLNASNCYSSAEASKDQEKRREEYNRRRAEAEKQKH